MIMPSGNRRQMKAQSYTEGLSSHDVIEKALRKAAALDVAPDEPKIEPGLSPQDKSPQPQTEVQPGQPDGTQTDVKPQKDQIADVMNQSNSLPPQGSGGIVLVDSQGVPRNDQQGKLATEILRMLLDRGFAREGTYVLSQFDTSNGIAMKATPKAGGPAVQKP